MSEHNKLIQLKLIICKYVYLLMRELCSVLHNFHIDQ